MSNAGCDFGRFTANRTQVEIWLKSPGQIW